ncbi:hypothetical protein RDI58_001280 [Solanum bulbocastanum]|uniref:Uncharacterized protein n=1 Tax=Solanum bulbocastanum TaxID=147425 RepID=A0AAN8UE36_SOLBU
MVGHEMKEEETQVDAKNPQKAEVDINFSSAEGTMGEETMKEGTEVDIDSSSAKDTMAEKVEWRQRKRLRMWIQIIRSRWRTRNTLVRI